MNTIAYDMMKELQILGHTISFSNDPANGHLFYLFGKTKWKQKNALCMESEVWVLALLSLISLITTILTLHNSHTLPLPHTPTSHAHINKLLYPPRHTDTSHYSPTIKLAAVVLPCALNSAGSSLLT